MWCEFGIIILICLVRCCRFGFEYFPVIDDWIQYMAYQSAPDLFERWFVGAGLYYTRPLAALMDLYIWGKIGMRASFVIITLLHGISGCLFLCAFRRQGIRAGIGFVLVYLLLPINTEGTIWLSASTRIVCSLFLASLSLVMLKKHKAIFWLFNLLSLFFYEQTAILSLVLALFFTHRERLKIIPVVNGLFFILYYVLFSGTGQFGSRSRIVFPDFQKIKSFVMAFYDGFFVKHWQLVANGARRGFDILSHNYWLFALVVAVSIALLFIIKEYKGHSGVRLGLILFVLPLAPYIVISQPLSFRAFMPSLVGLGLLTDSIIRCYPVKMMLSAVLIPVFLAVGISELTDYRTVSLTDRAMAQPLINTNAKSFKRQESVNELNVLYMQHITNVSESDWAMTGCIRAITKNPDYPILIIE